MGPLAELHNAKRFEKGECVTPPDDAVGADPDNWAIQAYEFDWVNANVIRDRASIAHAANKPIIIEETGMQVH